MSNFEVLDSITPTRNGNNKTDLIIYEQKTGKPLKVTESGLPIYHIDLNTRTIETPKYLSVLKDHRAENVYFSVDRYYGTLDISTMTCVVQYENAKGEQNLYPVQGYDIKSKADEGLILFEWPISGSVTKYTGTVKYSVMFFLLDDDNKVISVCLNTRPTSAQIQYGMDVFDSVIGKELDTPPEGYETDESLLKDLLARISRVEQKYDLYWEEASDIILDKNS